MTAAPRHALYGDLATRDAATLASVLVAKGIDVEWIAPTPSLVLPLALRAGSVRGPYLATPEGFVLGGLDAILDWLERVHPEPALLPATPLRRTCARLVEDWIAHWLPHWPRRSWSTIEHLAAHVEAAGFLLGPRPVRADWRLAAWLETEVLVHPHARAHVARHAPRFARYGDDLLAVASGAPQADDALPITLLDVLESIGRDYHAYLVANHRTLKDGDDRVTLDLGLGRLTLPVQHAAEMGRVVLGRELAALPRDVRRRVASVLEPLGAWHALTLPPAVEAPDPADPRSL